MVFPQLKQSLLLVRLVLKNLVSLVIFECFLKGVLVARFLQVLETTLSWGAIQYTL